MAKRMKQSADVVEEWIRQVNEEASKPLTSWEESFMISITDQFERIRYLTDDQVDSLERIYSQKTN